MDFFNTNKDREYRKVPSQYFREYCGSTEPRRTLVEIRGILQKKNFPFAEEKFFPANIFILLF